MPNPLIGNQPLAGMVESEITTLFRNAGVADVMLTQLTFVNISVDTDQVVLNVYHPDGLYQANMKRSLLDVGSVEQLDSRKVIRPGDMIRAKASTKDVIQWRACIEAIV